MSHFGMRSCVLLLVAACFPYRELYRPDLHGRVVDEAGAPVAGMTYRTAGPQYQQVLRTSLEPVLADFEDVWSNAWLPRGTSVRFRRSQLLREDLATSTTAAVAAYGAGLMSLAEARVEIGLPPDMTGTIGQGADIVTPSPDDPNAQLPGGEPGGGTPS